jgi:hypothetical protein
MVQTARTRVTAADYYQLPGYEKLELIQLINGSESCCAQSQKICVTRP